jgi:hypothetical protein
MTRFQSIALLLFTVLTVPFMAVALDVKDYSIDSLVKFVNEQQKANVGKNQDHKKPETFAQELKNLEAFKAEAQQILAAGGGGMDGGGGGFLIQEFFQYAHSILEKLRTSDSMSIDLEALELAIKTVEVEFVTEFLYLEGIRKDAINYRKTRLIRIHEETWKNIKSVAAKSAIVLHELLGIMGISDRKFEISYKVLGAINLNVVKEPAKIEADPGSYLHSYDLLSGEMLRLSESKNAKDRKKSVELAKSILNLFFGFSKIETEWFTDDTALIILASWFRELASYDPNDNSFLRFSDIWDIYANIHTTPTVRIAHDNIILRLKIVRGHEQGYSAAFEKGLYYCTITLNGGFISGLSLKQLFANLYNCGRLSHTFNTDIPLFESSYPTKAQIEENEKRDKFITEMTAVDIVGSYSGRDDSGSVCTLNLTKDENSSKLIPYYGKTSYADLEFDLLTGGLKRDTPNLFSGATDNYKKGCSGTLNVYTGQDHKPTHFEISGYCNSGVIQKTCRF